jgi:REP element-mobilizing transposase RayT
MTQPTFFISATAWQRRPIFLSEPNSQLLLDLLFEYRDDGKYLLHEFAVLPDMFHALLTPTENSLEQAVEFITDEFATRTCVALATQVWQRKIAAYQIRDAPDYERVCRCIRMSPVWLGWAVSSEKYPCSSANPVFRVDTAPPALSLQLLEFA